ncbi:MAG: hypothetical protein WAV73_02170 [Candidatus Moraniibacteriota bacterium]
MEKEKINSLITGYIKENLSPTERERANISRKYDEIWNLLIGNEIFQSGSYARFTSITPVSDLDIIWVIPRDIIDKKIQSFGLSEKAIDPRMLNLPDILTDLTKKLESEYARIGQKVTIKSQTHSVGVYFGNEDEFSIDIVPAIRSGYKNEHLDDIYLVPEDTGSEIIWIKSDPKGYIKEAQGLNSKNDSFRKTVKFVKKWKNSCKRKNKLFPLKSFHLETIVKEIIVNNYGISVHDALLSFYTELDFYLSEPKFSDKANSGTFIDDYVKNLSEEEIDLVTKMKSQALDSIEAMSESKDEADVITRIKEILSGEETFSHKISSLTKYAVSLMVPPSWQKPLPWPKIYTNKITIKCFLNGTKQIPPKELLFPGKRLKFVAEYSSDYDEIYWQVVNTGEHAIGLGEYALRGDYFEAKDFYDRPSENPFINWERTEYHGCHWISCFAVRNNKCVAISDPFYVRIFNKSYMRYKKPRR